MVNLLVLTPESRITTRHPSSLLSTESYWFHDEVEAFVPKFQMKCCHLVILVKKWRVHPSGFQTSTRFVIESKNESCTYSLTGEELSKSVWSTAIAKQDLFSLACQPIHSFSYKVNRVRKLIFCKLAHIHIVYIEVIGLETNVWKSKRHSEKIRKCKIV